MAKPKRRGRKLLLLLGLGGAAAAGFAAYQRSAPKDDPWATPLQDPYIAPSAGRSTTAPVDDTTPAAAAEEPATEEQASTEESAAEKAAESNVDTAKTVRGASAGD